MIKVYQNHIKRYQGIPTLCTDSVHSWMFLKQLQNLHMTQTYEMDWNGPLRNKPVIAPHQHLAPQALIWDFPAVPAILAMLATHGPWGQGKDWRMFLRGLSVCLSHYAPASNNSRPTGECCNCHQSDEYEWHSSNTSRIELTWSKLCMIWKIGLEALHAALQQCLCHLNGSTAATTGSLQGTLPGNIAPILLHWHLHWNSGNHCKQCTICLYHSAYIYTYISADPGCARGSAKRKRIFWHNNNYYFLIQLLLPIPSLSAIVFSCPGGASF